MNKENIEILIKHLKEVRDINPDLFDMLDWGAEFLMEAEDVEWDWEECKTAACLAGHAVAVLGDYTTTEIGDIMDQARVLLSLTFKEASRLFIPWSDKPELQGHDFGIEEAIATLERFLETGKAEWQVNSDACITEEDE